MNLPEEEVEEEAEGRTYHQPAQPIRTTSRMSPSLSAASVGPSGA